MKNKIRLIVNFLLVTIVLLITSCVDGFKENEVFSSDVKNATLVSPDSIAFTPDGAGATLTITWPVVHGAGGYQVSFYKMDDPANPVVIGTENQVVDGCSTTRAIEEDTKYKVVVKALGNTQYNNKDAVAVKEAAYSTLLPVTDTIKSGADLSVYFASKPIPSSATELVYQLEAGGTYTMSGNVSLPLTNVTIRGDKVNRPTVTMSAGAFVSDGAGFKLKFIRFDCAGFTGKSLLAYNATQNPAAISNGWVTVASPVAIQSCLITGLAKELLDDSNKKYAVQNFIIKNCIIEQNSIDQYLIYMQGGIIKDLLINSSTIYNKQISNQYFIRYSSNRITANSAWNWASASVTVTNSTFWQVAKTGQMGNYSGMGLKGNTLTIQQCIFVDCGNQAVVRRFAASGTNMTRILGYNSYWFDGAFVAAEIATNYDNSSTYINTNPALKDPANGDFTVGGADQISNRTGDPRWLPIQ